MAFVVDSNVLILAVNAGHQWSQEAREALEAYLRRDPHGMVTLQIKAEFWNVATRPKENNGLGLPPSEAAVRLLNLDPVLTVLHDTAAVHEAWMKLLLKHQVRGRQVHDARIAASLIAHGVTRILTYNPADFARYAPAVTPVHPSQV